MPTMIQSLARVCAATLCLAFWPASGVAQAGDCPSPNTPDQIRERLIRAQTAFGDLDIDSFTFAMEEVGLMIPCLDRVPGVAFSAELHRMQGVAFYAADQRSSASNALRAAKVLEPDYQFPSGMFPDGYALLDEWEAMKVGEPLHRSAPVPRKSAVAFDGQTTRSRPVDRATLFQHVDTSGGILQTKYLLPAEPLPTYVSVPRQRNRLIGATALCALVSGTFYKLSTDSVARFEQEGGGLNRKEMIALRERANRYYTVSGITAALTGAGIVGSITIGHR